MLWLKLRASEWVVVGFFAYVALISGFFPERPLLRFQPLFLFAGVSALLSLLSRLSQTQLPGAVSYCRDFLPLGLTLVAFHEMELFLPRHFDHHLESAWVPWDHLLLTKWHLCAAIESLGNIFPAYLEFCYLLVYGLPFYCLTLLYVQHKRQAIDRFLVIYLVGTLAAYALFPYFPSQPPRIAFPSLDPPHITTILRRWNLAILNAATIHVGVFPSAHVSSAFAAAWGMFLVIRRKVFGSALLVYAVSVSLATVYGRYHYAADVAAGFAVSLIPAALAIMVGTGRSSRGA
ncbi:MAG: phosphatase PAP2 family protein [Acidobacteriaceae bacterium]|nr:phosphatase PAP2 family protein [Acidobacteriaceae bacterium]